MPNPSASLKRRLCALLYECLLLSSVSLVALLLTAPFSYFFGTQIWIQVMAGICLLIAWALYFRIAWLRKGQTLPMKVWKIRLEDMHGNLLNPLQAWIRFIWAVIFFVVIPICVYSAARASNIEPHTASYLGMIWWILPLGYVFFNKDRQFLHDKLSGTRLVLESKN